MTMPQHRTTGHVAATLGACVLMAVPITGRGKDEPETSDEPEEDYVTVVTASGVPEKELLSPFSVSVLHEEEIEDSGHVTVPEAMKEAGVYVQKTNPGGGQPILRGLLGFHNLILVDGVRLNTSAWRSGPVQYLNTLDIWDVTRIELTRGPGSVLWGSGAMGGVIQVFTQQPVVPGSAGPYIDPTIGFRYTQASDGISFHYSLVGGVGPVAVQTNASIKSFGNILGGSNVAGFTFDEEPHAGFAEGSGGPQPWTGYDEHDGGVKLAWIPAPGHLLTFNWQRVHLVDAGRADQLLARGRVRFYDNLRDLIFVRWEVEAGGFLTWTTVASWHHQDELVNDLRLDPGWSTWHRQDHTGITVESLGLSSSGNMIFLDERLELSVGANFYLDLVDSFAKRRESPSEAFAGRSSPFPTGSRALDLGVFTMVKYHHNGPLGDGLHAWAGGRLAWFGTRSDAHDGMEAVRHDVVSPLGSAGIQWVQGGVLAVSAQYLQGFRAPSLSETVMSGFTGSAMEIPNPHLKPERSHTFELGVKLDFGQLSVRASGWASLLTDFIQRVDTGETMEGLPVERNENASRAVITGYDFTMRLELPAGLYLGCLTGFTWGDAWFEGSKEPVSRIPPMHGQGFLGYRNEKVGLVAEVMVRGASEQDRLAGKDLNDVRIPDGGTPGFITMDLMVGWRWNEILSLGVKLVNLFDTKYRIHGSGFWDPGVSAIAWMTLSAPGDPQ